MSDTGWVRGGSVANNSAVGGTNTWGNPNLAIDGDIVTYSATNLIPVTEYTQYLQVTNFGFSISVGSTIDKISVRAFLDRFGNTGARDGYIKLVKGGTAGGTNVATATAWSNGYKEWSGDSYGLWGNTLSATDINSSSFGVAISGHANNTGTNVGFKVYDVQITVYYTPETPPTVGTKYPLPPFKIT